jgi:hypothetical protein
LARSGRPLVATSGAVFGTTLTAWSCTGWALVAAEAWAIGAAVAGPERGASGRLAGAAVIPTTEGTTFVTVTAILVLV